MDLLKSKYFIAFVEKLKQEHRRRVDEILAQVLDLHYGVYTYFNGDGPAGRYLKQRLLEARTFDSDNAELRQQADVIERALSRFALPVKRDREEARRFKQKLLDIYQQIYSPQEALALLPEDLSFLSRPHLDENTVRKVYEQVVEHDIITHKDQDPECGLALRLTYPYARILVIFNRTEFFAVYWYHEAENTWLAWDGETIFEGMTDFLEYEWEIRQSTLGPKLPSKEEVVIHERVDWTHEQILKMVEMVFSADQYLEMTDDPCYTREAGEWSRLAFEHDNYQWIFLDTRGAWPSRSDVLTRKTLENAAGIGHSVKWESLSEQTKQGLYNAAGNACSRLQMLIASRMEIQSGKVADEHQRTL